jgi:hypothetical protein
MGASFTTVAFPRKRVPDATQLMGAFTEAQWLDRYQNGHSYSGSIGMANGLVVTKEVFNTREEAEVWLADNTYKWESAKAVVVVSGDFFMEEGNYWLVGAWCSS